MKRLALALSLAVAFAAPVAAQQPAPQIATLTAEGEGIATAVPDIVIIGIGVTTRGETPADALAANSTDMQRVIDTILAAGVAETDVSTSGFSINPVYAVQRAGEEDQPARIIAYEVTNRVTVRIRDLANSGAVVDRVVAAGANRINGISFDVAEPQPLRDEAMTAAIADARRKAELMAQAAGVRLVRILTVGTYSNAQPVFQQDALYARAAANTPIMGGEQQITATATLTYEIEPAQ